ncbi:glycosyltransferase family 2 protein [Candidatus Roizmanbacteria bacterium]|nr:glycosyltransferase family 2 protein [Candidatus Roizmanbacteria bacterium]
MQTITAIIPTKNEEKNIEQCLKSLLWCNKIIVIVTGTDKTDRIAKKLGAQVVIKRELSKKDDFEKAQHNINWAIKNCTTDWMIRVDADEVVSSELVKEIVSILKSKTKNLPVAYGIPRKQYFLGAFLKGGDWAYDRLTRLFKPKFCLYDPIVKIHEQIKVNGKIGYLKNSLLHYSHPDQKTLLKKFNSYTTLEAKQLKGTKLSAFFKLFFIPPYIFLRWMIYHHGYRDGWIGLLAGLMRAYYEVLLYSKFIFS